MTSFCQWQANRRNAAKSTGPITPDGKARSRCNALRHGLTAGDGIGALENPKDYKAFEAAIMADYDAQSAVERELASALWRLRRATAMETGLFAIEADHLSASEVTARPEPPAREIVYAIFRSDRAGNDRTGARLTADTTTPAIVIQGPSQDEEPTADPSRHLAQCLAASRQPADLPPRPPQSLRIRALASGHPR